MVRLSYTILALSCASAVLSTALPGRDQYADVSLSGQQRTGLTKRGKIMEWNELSEVEKKQYETDDTSSDSKKCRECVKAVMKNGGAKHKSVEEQGINECLKKDFCKKYDVIVKVDKGAKGSGKISWKIHITRAK